MHRRRDMETDPERVESNWLTICDDPEAAHWTASNERRLTCDHRWKVCPLQQVDPRRSGFLPFELHAQGYLSAYIDVSAPVDAAPTMSGFALLARFFLDEFRAQVCERPTFARWRSIRGTSGRTLRGDALLAQPAAFGTSETRALCRSRPQWYRLMLQEPTKAAASSHGEEFPGGDVGPFAETIASKTTRRGFQSESGLGGWPYSPHSAPECRAAATLSAL
jgi:hypothetical protein